MTSRIEPPDHEQPTQEQRRAITDQQQGTRQHLSPISTAFDAETIEAVKRAHPLLAVLAGYGIAVQGTGQHRMARCPFHDDTRPSLGVFLETGRFFCFGCGASGDVIAFVQQVEGIGFRDAIQHLMQTAPVRDPSWQIDRVAVATVSASTSGRGDSVREAASCNQPHTLAQTNVNARGSASRKEPTLPVPIDRALLTAAAAIYQAALRFSPLAHAYLRSRHIPPRVAQEARLGYADGTALLQYLGQSDELLRAAHRIGLLDDKGQERFRGRLIIPEFRMGQCVWLHGRLIPRIPIRISRSPTDAAHGDTSETQQGSLPMKYLGCALSKPLFGVGLCERDRGDATLHVNSSVRRSLLIVEGALDVLAVRTLRIPVACVALIGTHAGPTQRRELLQLADGGPIFLALDADTAGDAGAERLAMWLHDYAGALYRIRPSSGVKDFAELIEVLAWREARSTLSDSLRRCEQLLNATMKVSSNSDSHEHERLPSSDDHKAKPRHSRHPAGDM